MNVSLNNKDITKPWKIAYVGDQAINHNVDIKEYWFSEEQFFSTIYMQVDEFVSKQSNESGHTQLIVVNGIHRPEFVKEVGELYSIHGVTIEDILDTKQRPKVEFHKDYIFLSLKSIDYDEENETFVQEQISFILKENVIIVFTLLPSDSFKRVLSDLGISNSFIRQRKADFLFYRLLDVVVDNYFKVVEQIDNEVSIIENALDEGSSGFIIDEVYWLKKELLSVKKVVFPIRDAVSSLMRDQVYLISNDTKFYLKDTYDHCSQINDSISISHELVTSFYDRYISKVNKKTNEVMVYLTVFSTIFIPLTFITSIYGMNFKYMPEIEYKYSYFALLFVLFTIGMIIYFFFKRKKWIGK